MHIYYLSGICQAMKSYQMGVHESQQLIRYHANQLGIHSFHRTLSDAVTEIISHRIDSLAIYGERSHATFDGKIAHKPRQRQRYQSRMKGYSSHSGSVSDTESNYSDGSGYGTRNMFARQHASSTLSSGRKLHSNYSLAHSSDLAPIAQSPPAEDQFPCGGSSAEARSLDSQAKERKDDDTESLPFGSQPTVSPEHTNMC